MANTKVKLLFRDGDHASKTAAEEYRERLDREEREQRWHLEAIDSILAETEASPEQFHRDWIMPLLSAGVTIESAFSLLVAGKFQPN